MDGWTDLALEAAEDPGAQAALVAAAYPAVWQLCAALVDRQSADDLAQECFVRTIRSLPRFRAEASARTWLLSIARRTCMDELRARHRRRRRDASRSALRLDAEPVLDDPTEASALGDLLARLDPDRRSAFVLTQHLGLSYEEAAKVCDCPIGTIRSRVARARADLVTLLGATEAEPGPATSHPPSTGIARAGTRRSTAG